MIKNKKVLFNFYKNLYNVKNEYNIRGGFNMHFTERKRWVFLGLPFTFTKYTIKEDLITVDTGFLNKVQNDCYMYKVQDVRLKASLMERIFKLGTVICFTGDTTDPTLELLHIKNAKAVKDFILQTSESARIKRRTLNTLDIGTGSMDDIDNPNF